MTSDSLSLKVNQEENLNWPLFILIFLLPLQNIYIGKIPPFGGGVNILNILMVLSFIVAITISTTRFNNSVNLYIFILMAGYILSFLQSENQFLINSIKDLFFSYLIFFITYKSLTGIKSFKFIFWATVLPLPYMFKVFYSNLSWMGFSTYKDKLRFNSGTFMELGSNEIAAFYATYTFVILAVAFCETDRRLRWVLFFIAGMNIYSLIYTFSRGAYLSSLVAFGIFAFLNRKVKQVLVGLTIILLLSAFGAEILPKAVSERFDSSFASEEELDESAQTRIALWDIAMDKFAESPILGIGYGNFKKINSYGLDTHNYYLKMLVEGGLVALISLVLLFLAALCRGVALYRNATDPFFKSLSTGFIACMVAMMIGNYFGDRFTHYPLISYFFVYLAMVVKGLEWSVQNDAKTA